MNMSKSTESTKYSDKEIRAAEKKLISEVRHKDFWSVTVCQDNFDELQGVLDVLFNSIEGNNYSVEYQDNMNGTRLIINCKVCGKELTSYDPFITHENGKIHKKIRGKLMCSQEPNIEGELELQHLNKPRGTFPEGSLEEQIDSTKKNVLGVQFVYKEVIDGRDTYTCQLCQHFAAEVYQIPSSKMFLHLTSEQHNLTYLKVKFGYIKKSPEQFQEECCFVEEFEGKVHASIADLTSGFHAIKSRELGNRHHSRSISPPACDSHLKVPKVESREICYSDDITGSSARPQASDVGISVDMSSESCFILHDINALQEADCQMILQDDADMQDLLQETLWALTNKMERFYNKTGATYIEGTTRIPLSASAEKVKQYIAEFAGLK